MQRKFLKLTDDDIRNNKFLYDPEQIEYSIRYNCLSLRIVSRYQKLTPYICSKYVIFGGNDEKYGDCTEDRWLDDNDIISRQPHISQEQLIEAHTFVFYEEEREMEENIFMNSEDKFNKNN